MIIPLNFQAFCRRQPGGAGMNRGLVISGSLFFGLAQALAAATVGGPDFDSYRVILDRKPFGEVTPSETLATTSAPTDTLTRDLVMRSIVDEGNNVVRVGFLDKKSNKTFYLGIGETNEAYELVSVNYDEEEAVLKRGSESSLFTLKPNKTPSPAGLPSAAGTAAGGFAPALPSGVGAAQGFTPVPFTEGRKPFFSDVNKKKFSPFRPVGSNPIPFQAQSLDTFMKANSNAAPGFAGFRPFEPASRTNSRGDTIDRLLRANPDAARKFAPLNPLAPNPAAADGRAGALDNFFTPNQALPPESAPLFTSPAPEESDDPGE